MRKRKVKPEEIVALYLKGKKTPLYRSPQELDEEALSGTMAGLESDDDVLEAAHQMGIGLSEDYEHPKELNIAQDIDRAEEYKRTH